MRLRFLILLLLIPLLSFAQTVIKGKVTDADNGQPLDMATVVLERNHTPINYVLTDANGNYILRHSNIVKGDLLSITYLGYQKMSIPVSGQNIINFNMKPQAFTLKEVEIKGGRIFGRQDTTRYDISRFITDRDNNLKDALKKLPGIDIDKNGAVSYNGKEISRFTVEGLDISGGRYNILNENIKAKDVDKAEIIDHYQPIRSLAKKVFSEDVALNIKLQPQAKDKWIYTFKMAAGLSDIKNPVIWNGNINAMQIGKKKQCLYNFKSDNTGLDLENENMQLTRERNNLLLPNSSIPMWLYQPSLNAPLEAERMRFNHSYSFNYGRLQNKSEETQLRVNAGYIHNENEQQTFNSSIYNINGNNIETYQQQNFVRRKDGINADVSIEKNSNKYYLRNATTFNGYMEKSNSLFSNNGNEIWQTIKTPQVGLDNSLRIVSNKERYVLNFQSYTSAKYSPSQLILKNENEKMSVRRLYTDNAMSWMLKSGFITQEYSLGVSAENMFLYNHNWATSIYSRPHFEYKSDKLVVNLNALVEWKRFCEQQKSYLLFSPQLNVNLKSGYRGSFSLFGCYLENAGGWNSILPDEYRQDYRTWIATNGIIPKYDYYTISGGYEYKHPLHELFWSYNLSYARNNSNTITNLKLNDGNYYYESIQKDNYTEQYSAKMNISKGWFNLNLKSSCILKYDIIDGVNMTNSQLISYKLKQASIEPKIIYSPSWGEIEYSSTIRYSRTKQDKSKDEHINLINWVQNATFTKSIGNVDCKFNLSHYRNDLYSGDKSYFTLADASVIWRLKNVRLSGSVKNIFNKKEYSYTINQGNMSSTDKYILRPREWMISVQWNL